MDYTIKLTDAAIIAATLLGPIFAVQAQKWLERHRAVEERRSRIFRTLMATRAARLSAGHVEALNAIPVEFHGHGKKLKAIVDDWHTYLDKLNDTQLEGQIVGVERQKAFTELLHKISIYLGYQFSKSELENDVYYPKGHRVIDDDQEIIRRGVAQLLKGEISIPMAVKEFPATADPTTLANGAAIQRALLEWLQGERAVQITNAESSGGSAA